MAVLAAGSKPDPARIGRMLRSNGLSVTRARVAICQILFSDRQHISADDIYSTLRQTGSSISRATVYNVLKALCASGLSREILADPKRVYYEPKTTDHFHCYNVDTETIYDIPRSTIAIETSPSVFDGMDIVGVDLIVRVRSANRSLRPGEV